MTQESSIGSCIIVGGGPGGVHVARNIVKNCGGSVHITIVDRQDYLDWSLASPRMLIAPNDVDKFGYCMPLPQVCEFVAGRQGKIKFVHAGVSKIGPKSVTLENGSKLEADVIVVATGGSYASGAMWKPLKDQTTKEARVAALRVQRQELAKAKHVLITGAGPTAVEVAGELKAAFPKMAITMVGSLLPTSPPALQTRMAKSLTKMGIILVDGRVDATEPDKDGNVVTRTGKTIGNVDVILNAAGFTFAGNALASDELKKDVTTRGQFSCRPTLQLASVDSVFCCGDILAVPEGYFADVKGLQHADDTAETVGKNVGLLLKKKPLQNFKWSKVPVNMPMMTALGPKVGVGHMGLPNFMENFMCRQFKCKDYYMSIKGKSYGKGKTWK